jgi:hypothetical protein
MKKNHKPRNRTQPSGFLISIQGGAVTVHFSTRFAMLAISAMAAILKGHTLIAVAKACAAFFK